VGAFMVESHLLLAEQNQRINALPHYNPTERAWDVLVHGRIISSEETPQDLLERIISAIFSVETDLGVPPEETKKLIQEFAECMTEGYVMLGTPILTNAGRYNTSLSSCAIVPVNLQSLDTTVEERLCDYYRQNMGSGFDFTPYKNPTALLYWLNDLSQRESATGRYDRYIGNMGLLHISHPAIQEFISAKRERDLPHFNISIDVSDTFMKSAREGKPFVLANDTQVQTSDILQQIAENAWYNGEPGLVFLERMNKDNPLASLPMMKYVSTPPCGEMGLVAGETCHFGYLNVRRFVHIYGETVTFDYDKLKQVTSLLTRVLDNAIEYSIPRYPTQESRDIARKKRKIGIGICGLADTFLAYNLTYDSLQARELARNILSFINFVSKCSSVALAEQRGSCTAMEYDYGNEYLHGTYLERKYARNATDTVTAKEWQQLALTIRETKLLRNISTTALPPTGRSSLLLDTTASIEPLLSIVDSKGNISSSIKAFLVTALRGDTTLIDEVSHLGAHTGSFQHIESLPLWAQNCLKTAKEIKPIAHLEMVATVAGIDGVVDESASKTVNIANEATIKDVRELFLAAYELGLKNISVYRDKTKIGQPVA